MFNLWFTAITYSIIHLGFSALLGTQIYQLKNTKNTVYPFNLLITFSLVLLSPLGLAFWGQWISWIVALVISSIFALRPTKLPAYLWEFKFALGYASIAMMMIAIWGALQGIQFPGIFFSSLAATAAVLAWVRSYQKAF